MTVVTSAAHLPSFRHAKPPSSLTSTPPVVRDKTPVDLIRSINLHSLETSMDYLISTMYPTRMELKHPLLLFHLYPVKAPQFVVI
jgi:hypothetical protein